MRCPECGREIETIDYPEMIRYHKEDVKWGIWPDHDTEDPGMLVAKSGAKPIIMGCDKLILNRSL